MSVRIKRRNIRASLRIEKGSSTFEKLNNLYRLDYTIFYDELNQIHQKYNLLEKTEGTLYNQEAWIIIFRYLYIRDVPVLSCVSKLFNRISSLDIVWRNFYRLDYRGGLFGEHISEIDDGMWMFKYKERFSGKLVADIVFMKERDELTADWMPVILCVYDVFLFIYDYKNFINLPRHVVKKHFLAMEFLPEPMKKISLDGCSVNLNNTFFSTKKRLDLDDRKTGERILLGMDNERTRNNWYQLIWNRIRIMESFRKWDNFKHVYYVPERHLEGSW